MLNKTDFLTSYSLCVSAVAGGGRSLSLKDAKTIIATEIKLKPPLRIFKSHDH